MSRAKFSRLTHLKAYVELCGVRIGLFASLAAATGYMLAACCADSRIMGPVAGVFLLACGARSMNQYQEREIDAYMPRTLSRPLPSGRLRAREAVAVAVSLIVAGLVVLLLTGSVSAFFLGVCAVIWYNGLYTHLKRYSAFAVVPGAVVGALPPAIGWATAGGAMADDRLLSLCFFFFMWQIPHSWIFMLRYGDEYRAAGLPSLTGVFGTDRLRRIVFSWMSAAALSSLFVVRTGVIHHTSPRFAIAAASAVILVLGMRLLLQKDQKVFATAYRGLNLYALLLMATLVADRLPVV